MQDETEGAVRTLSSRASKWAPTWHSSPITPKSLSGQPLDRVWIRLARKGFWGNGWAMSCGGSFRSSWWERSHSAFSFVLHFFYHPNLAIWTKCSIYGALFIVLTIILKNVILLLFIHLGSQSELHTLKFQIAVQWWCFGLPIFDFKGCLVTDFYYSYSNLLRFQNEP